MNSLQTRRGTLPLPVFMPDATRGVVRAVDSDDVTRAGVQCVMVNTLHLANAPGASLIEAHGGLHRFMGWNGPIASDSGGFQAYSFVAGSGKLGSISVEGLTYRLPNTTKKQTLTPELCIRRQFQFGTDIQFCLDHCVDPKAPENANRESVDNTVRWACACKREFDRHAADHENRRPLLFAVVQGGPYPDLRRECAERLADIGFDGYGFGGWPVNEEGGLVEAVRETAEYLPKGSLLHGLGIGKPENVVEAFDAGYTLFDCVLPTRDARHKRLFVYTDPPGADHVHQAEFYSAINIGSERYARDKAPVDPTCDCHCCTTYSRAYLRHLFKINETTAQRLATIHNLRFYTRLMEALRESSGRANSL